MSISRFLKAGLVLLILSICTTGVFAASWLTNGPKRDIVTLVVTGNYKSPRLMAELILNESRQPYLLLPTPQSKVQKIIFVQPNWQDSDPMFTKGYKLRVFTKGFSYDDGPKGRVGPLPGKTFYTIMNAGWLGQGQG